MNDLRKIAEFAEERALLGAKRLFNENGVPASETNDEFAEWAAHIANLFTIAKALRSRACEETF